VLFRVLKEAFSSRRSRSAAAGMHENPLVAWCASHDGRCLVKWLHYLEIYHRHFARYRGASPVVLEIGVFQGGSLQMWRDYFGPGCRLYGMDVDQNCRAYEQGDTKILIGDQADREFLARLRRELPRIDVLIDDGGHRMNQQIATFEELYRHVTDDGVYLCEDLHTSYWDAFGGGYREPQSFIEFSKRLVDQLNAWHSKGPEEFTVDDFTRTAFAMHYYDSVLVIEKRPMREPARVRAGRAPA
jgi:hypothetical protein